MMTWRIITTRLQLDSNIRQSECWAKAIPLTWASWKLVCYYIKYSEFRLLAWQLHSPFGSTHFWLNISIPAVNSLPVSSRWRFPTSLTVSPTYSALYTLFSCMCEVCVCVCQGDPPWRRGSASLAAAHWTSSGTIGSNRWGKFSFWFNKKTVLI
jgi:hypothetical protein